MASEKGCGSFMSPRVILALFIAINFITYFDRGAIAGVMSAVEHDHVIAGHNKTLSDAQGGAMASAFIVGFMIACPLFTTLGGTIAPTMIICIGLVSWAVSCLMCAFAANYAMLVAARCMVGVGEAAYAGFTVTIIDNVAPPARRTMWIGAFYCMIPTGMAFGMAVGGIMASSVSIGSIPGWRVVFFAEVIPMVPLIILTCLIPAKYNPVSQDKQVAESDSPTASPNSETPIGSINEEEEQQGDGAHVGLMTATKHVPVTVAIKQLVRNVDYLILIFAYGMYNFVIGPYGVWVIKFLTSGKLKLGTNTASIFVGASAAFTGVVGSAAGGYALDRLGGSRGTRGLSNSAMMCGIVQVVAAPFAFVCFFVSIFGVFAGSFFVAELFCFAVTAPANAALLTVVKPELRTYSVTISTLFMHLIGDFPADYVTGVLSDKFSKGCPEYPTETTCNAHEDRGCHWVALDSDKGSCYYEDQLGHALLVISSGLIISAMAYFVVALRMRKRASDDLLDGNRSLIHNDSDVG